MVLQKEIKLTQRINTSIGISISEYAINVVILFFLSGAILYLFGDESGSNSSSSGSKLANAIWILIYIVIIGCVKNNFNLVFNGIKNNFLIVLLTGIVIASITWSQAPEVTLRRSVSFLICLIYGFYLSEKFDSRQIVTLFYYLSCFVACSSLIFILLVPKFGLASGVHKGAWQGVYFHKNGLGRIAGLCLITTILYFLEFKANRFYAFINIIFCFLLLVMSKSSTALVAFAIIIPAYALLRWTYRKYNIMKSVLNVTILIILSYLSVELFNAYSQDLFGEMGKDDSFSGRVPLWVMLVEYIWQSPFLGYGYSAFWIPKILSKSIWVDTSWAPEQGHNGFIDLTLELGLTGLFIFLIILFKSYKRCFDQIKNNPDYTSYWYILTLIYLTVVSFTESFIIKYNNIYWLMLLICCISIKKNLQLFVRNLVIK